MKAIVALVSLLTLCTLGAQKAEAHGRRYGRPSARHRVYHQPRIYSYPAPIYRIHRHEPGCGHWSSSRVIYQEPIIYDDRDPEFGFWINSYGESGFRVEW